MTRSKTAKAKANQWRTERSDGVLVGHFKRTGERPVERYWNSRPAAMDEHGGYVAVSGEEAWGPFAFYENALSEAGRRAGGFVMRWRDAIARGIVCHNVRHNRRAE